MKKAIILIALFAAFGVKAQTIDTTYRYDACKIEPLVDAINEDTVNHLVLLDFDIQLKPQNSCVIKYGYGKPNGEIIATSIKAYQMDADDFTLWDKKSVIFLFNYLGQNLSITFQ